MDREEGSCAAANGVPTSLPSPAASPTEKQTTSESCQDITSLGPSKRKAPSFRPPYSRLSTPSSKVHSAFKSPLRVTTSSSPSTPPDTSSSTTPPATSSNRSFKAPTTLSSSTRHQPYSLTPTRSHHSRHSNKGTPGEVETEESLRADVARLREQIGEVDKEIEELSKDYHEDELQQYIDHLHEYNDIKDAAQLLLGRLAEAQCTTVAELYKQFDINLDD